MPDIVKRITGAFVDSGPNKLEETPVDARVAGATTPNTASQESYGAAVRGTMHRRRSRSKQRKKLKRLLRQVSIVGVTMAVIALALLWWRYLVG
jgi:hypothetical protein